jgi:hypothetical protein
MVDSSTVAVVSSCFVSALQAASTASINKGAYFFIEVGFIGGFSFDGKGRQAKAAIADLQSFSEVLVELSLTY